MGFRKLTISLAAGALMALATASSASAVGTGPVGPAEAWAYTGGFGHAYSTSGKRAAVAMFPHGGTQGSADPTWVFDANTDSPCGGPDQYVSRSSSNPYSASVFVDDISLSSASLTIGSPNAWGGAGAYCPASYPEAWAGEGTYWFSYLLTATLTATSAEETDTSSGDSRCHVVTVASDTTATSCRTTRRGGGAANITFTWCSYPAYGTCNPAATTVFNQNPATRIEREVKVLH